jgi:hypothetical protein
MRRIARLAALGAAFLVMANGPARAEDVGRSGPRSLGQRLYVPVHSSIHAMKDRQLELAVAVSVRNTGAEHSIRVEAVRYFGDQKQESGSTEPCLMGCTRLLALNHSAVLGERRCSTRQCRPFGDRSNRPI